LTLSAQETPRATADAVAARFKQLDRNGDGKLTADEAGQFPWFKRSDTNNDGVVTLEEVQAVFGQPAEAATSNPSAVGGLRSARTVCVSPFPEDKGRVLYFGGFDAAQGPHRDSAWIYKGTLLIAGKEKP
jgi:hypothetical protein